MVRFALTAVFVASAAFAASCAADGAAADPPPRAAQNAIVGGSPTSGFPAVGALTYVYPGFGYQGSFCTGTLIAPDWVLTAAHCVDELEGFALEPQITYFYLGPDANPAGPQGPASGELYQADLFVIHPGWNPTDNDNDIALVHLAQPVAGVSPYTPNSAFLNAVGATPQYCGYGATEGVDSTGGGIKRSPNTPIPITWIYPKVFVSDFTGSGTCFGDSGGPSLLDLGQGEVIIGVNSALASCDPQDPQCPTDPCQGTAITTRVDVFAPWIASVTGGVPPNCTTTPTMCSCVAACASDGSCDNTACQTADCETTYQCLSDCGQDDACAITCYTSATQQAQDQLDSLQTCLSDNCGALQGDAYQDCATTQCGTQIDTCLPIGTGPATCTQVYDCMFECPAGDSACTFACYENGTAQAQSQYDAMQDCFSSSCAGLTGDAFNDCAYANCESHIDACLPPVYGDQSCEAVQDCYATCADGDQPCINACFQTGSQAAQAALDAMGACFTQFCDGLTDDPWLECVYANCDPEITACFPPSNCNVAGGDCAAGEACYPTANDATDCFPSDELTEGAPCTPPVDSTGDLPCDDGLICIGPQAGPTTCEGMCTLDQHCAPGLECVKPIFTDIADIGLCGCVDNDNDTYCENYDCDDDDPASYPGATEICGDGVDQDCSGADLSCGGSDGSGAADTGGPSDAGSSGDAGAPPDAGPGAPDAGPGPPDAGSDGGGPGPSDAGGDPAPQLDAGAGPDVPGLPGFDAVGFSPDTGTSAPTPSEPDDGCEAAGNGGPLGSTGALVLIIGALLCVRRRPV